MYVRMYSSSSADPLFPLGAFPLPARFSYQAGVSVAGGSDRPPAAEFRELSLAPWDYVRQLMEFSRAVAGVAAVAAVLHTVWPFRGPVALGGEKKGHI